MGASAIEIEGHHDVEPIGSGGVGVVYRATRSSTGRVVAIKVLRDLSDESVAWHRTRRELTALVALAGHANVIQLFEVFELPQGPALSMEYAPGGSIADLLDRRQGVLPIAETVLVGRHTAAGLAAAHAQGIVHRDIKPQNLLIDAFGQVKLCDFGIASLTRTEGFRTRTNAWSMRYASPEDLDGDLDVGPASDVYSLGATLLHLAHGAPPSLKDRLVEWVPSTSDDPHQTELDDLLASCLQPQPGRRPSAAEFVERLERLGWALDERCRALPVDAPVFVDRDDRSEAIAVGSRPVRVADLGRPSLDSSDGLDPDETVVRPGRRPPARPSGRARPRRRWRAFVAATTVLVVLGLAALVWWPTGGSNEMASSIAVEFVASPPAPAVTTPSVPAEQVEPTPTTIAASNERVLSLGDRPGDLVAIDDASLVWPFGDVGECLIQMIGVAELQPVSCEQPHDLQRIAVSELDTTEFPPGSAFDQANVQAAVEVVCATAFESFVGPEAEQGVQGVLDVPVTRPSAASWQQGDRRFQCLVGASQRRIVGDAGPVTDNEINPCELVGAHQGLKVVERGVDPRTPRFSGVCSAD